MLLVNTGRDMDKNRLTGHILAGFTILIWGTTFIASKVLLKYYSAAVLMTMRFIIAWLVLFLMRPKFIRIPLKDELKILACGVLSSSLYFAFETNALRFTLASNVSIIVAAAPILTSILAHFFTKDEKFHKNLLFGFLIAFTGVALVVFNGTVILKLEPTGDILSFFAALSWAGYSIVAKPLLKKYDILLLTRRIMFFGLITALPLLLLEKQPFSLVPLGQAENLIALAFLGVLGSGICYYTWNLAASRLGAVATNTYIYANPFITMLAAWILLNEKISLMGALGAILIILGVFLSGRIKKEIHT